MNSNDPTQPRSDVIIAPCCFNESLFIEKYGLKALLVRIKLSYIYLVTHIGCVSVYYGQGEFKFLSALMKILPADLRYLKHVGTCYVCCDYD